MPITRHAPLYLDIPLNCPLDNPSMPSESGLLFLSSQVEFDTLCARLGPTHSAHSQTNPSLNSPSMLASNSSASSTRYIAPSGRCLRWIHDRHESSRPEELMTRPQHHAKDRCELSPTRDPILHSSQIALMSRLFH